MKKYIKAALLALGLITGPLILHAAPVPITSVQNGVYIVNLNILATTTTWATEIALAQGLHAGVIRSNWDMIDQVWTDTFTWNFTKMDQVANMLRAANLKIYWTASWRAAWMAPHGSCQSVNPYFGVGTPGTTACPALDPSLPAIWVSTMVTRYGDIMDTVELPTNEPNLISASTDTRHHADIAARQAKAALDANPTIRLALPCIATPKLTVYNGDTTSGATQFRGHHYYTDFLFWFSSSMTYIGHGVSMPSFAKSFHGYLEDAGGGQTWPIIMSTMTQMSAVYSDPNPTLDATEVNVAGGTPTGLSSTWSASMAADIMRGYATFMSTNSAWTGQGSRFIVHNMQGLPISITTTSYTPLGVYNVVKRLYGLTGFTPMGDQGDGSNVRIFRFNSASGNTYVAWTESGTSSWNLNPGALVRVTDVSGLTTSHGAAEFTPYTLTTSPILVEVTTGSGMHITGGRLKGGRVP